jgi:hypothetical protein
MKHIRKIFRAATVKNAVSGVHLYSEAYVGIDNSRTVTVTDLASKTVQSVHKHWMTRLIEIYGRFHMRD